MKLQQLSIAIAALAFTDVCAEVRLDIPSQPGSRGCRSMRRGVNPGESIDAYGKVYVTDSRGVVHRKIPK